jgi:hypothetical protein
MFVHIMWQTNDRLDLIMPTIMEYALEYEAELWITSASTGYLIFLCDDKFDFSNFIYLLYREKCFRFI